MFHFLKHLFVRQSEVVPTASSCPKKSSALHRLERDCIRNNVDLQLRSANFLKRNQ